jgi:cell wall-associated NlpC family hydrolase
MFKKFLLILLVIGQCLFVNFDSNMTTVSALETDVKEETVEVFKEQSISLYVGEKLEIQINDVKDIELVSSDKDIITINNNKVTAVAKGEATIQAKQNNKVVDTCKVTVNVKTTNIADLTYNSLPNRLYKNKQIKPSVTIKNGSYTLVEDKDYTLSYGENVDLGKGSVTVKGINDYTGEKTLTFNIVKDINTLTVSSIANRAYTGSAIKPSITIKDGNYTLKEGSDYTVKYSNNTKTGVATATITGHNPYGGVMTKTFYIVPKKINTPTVTTGDCKMTVKWTKVTGASGYRIAYKKKGGKWSFINVSSSTSSKTITGLNSNTYYYVQVRAYVKVNGVVKYGTYSSAKKVKIPQSSKAKKIVAVAKSKLGTPYKWGATGPNSFDCSGFTRYVYKQATGKTLPHNSSAQKSAGKVVSLSNVQVGDVVWRSGHVGIYVGNGQVIHSPHSGAVVSYTTLKGFKCAVRY